MLNVILIIFGILSIIFIVCRFFIKIKAQHNESKKEIDKYNDVNNLLERLISYNRAILDWLSSTNTVSSKQNLKIDELVKIADKLSISLTMDDNQKNSIIILCDDIVESFKDDIPFFKDEYNKIVQNLRNSKLDKLLEYE